MWIRGLGPGYSEFCAACATELPGEPEGHELSNYQVELVEKVISI